MAGFSLDNYIDVAERIVLFKDQYPDGSLRTCFWEVREIGEKTFIVYVAEAYRTPDDQKPGMGTAWEPFPGPTQYTRDSELMNAETAAWGRAIVALGIVANRNIASRQEVTARQGGDTVQGSRNTGPASDKQLAFLKRLVTQHKPGETLQHLVAQVGAKDVDVTKTGWSKALNQDQASALIDIFQSGVVPTGESDIPSDLPPEPEVEPGDDIPFDVVGAEHES